jgi:hypothetical protein
VMPLNVWRPREIIAAGRRGRRPERRHRYHVMDFLGAAYAEAYFAMPPWASLRKEIGRSIVNLRMAWSQIANSRSPSPDTNVHVCEFLRSLSSIHDVARASNCRAIFKPWFPLQETTVFKQKWRRTLDEKGVEQLWDNVRRSTRGSSKIRSCIEKDLPTITVQLDTQRGQVPQHELFHCQIHMQSQ